MKFKFYSRNDNDKTPIWIFSAPDLAYAILIAAGRKKLEKDQFLELYNVEKL